MDDAYSVQTTAADSGEADGLEQLMALKDADTFRSPQWSATQKVSASLSAISCSRPSASPLSAAVVWTE